MAGEAI